MCSVGVRAGQWLHRLDGPGAQEALGVTMVVKKRLRGLGKVS